MPKCSSCGKRFRKYTNESWKNIQIFANGIEIGKLMPIEGLCSKCLNIKIHNAITIEKPYEMLNNCLNLEMEITRIDRDTEIVSSYSPYDTP